MASRPSEQGNVRGMSAQQPESTSVIDQYSNFDGTYNSSRDLRVEGRVTGTIVCKGTLHVAQGATVKAAVEAEAITVAGELEGEITCRGRLELLPSGRAKGQIATQSIVIHEGAVYEGELAMGANAGRNRRSRTTEREASETPVISAAEVTVSEATPAEDPPVPAAESEAQASRPSPFIRRFGGADTPSQASNQEPSDA